MARALFEAVTVKLPGAALAVGKDCGVVIPTTGTKSDPSNVATTTRVTFERNPSRIFFVLKDNMLNTRDPLCHVWINHPILRKYAINER
jgi:photosystem II stability/assembly factor-like uncharacterized protein